MSISFSSGKPIYGVKTSSGVSAACLPAYFEASGQRREIKLIDHKKSGISDSYRQRLENEIGYFAGKTNTGKNQISQVIYHLSLLFKNFVSQTVGKSDNLDNQILKNHGCVCSSSVKFSTTDSSIEKEHPDFFGMYSYKVQNTNTHTHGKNYCEK